MKVSNDTLNYSLMLIELVKITELHLANAHAAYERQFLEVILTFSSQNIGDLEHLRLIMSDIYNDLIDYRKDLIDNNLALFGS